MTNKPLPDGAKYVVIGAGMHGMSTAWHIAMALEKTGKGKGSDVVLLDKTGWMSAGIFLTLLVAAVTVTTVLSGAHYVWYWGIREESKRAR